jgi:hypothetical protein
MLLIFKILVENSVCYPVFSKGDSYVVMFLYNSEHQAKSCANLNFPSQN